MPSKPKFFATPADWRAWLEQNHTSIEELWVGLYKRDSGKPSITWPEAVDGALCFGWIDGVRKSVDKESYKIRFTPRKPRSVWSVVNVKRTKELSRLGLMHPAGQAAFEKHDASRSQRYSYEQRKTSKLPPAFEKQFRGCAGAWEFFQAQAPWYQWTCTWWVISAKKEETQRKRLGTLIECSRNRTLIPELERPSAGGRKSSK
jgi:uncharacterized protein YdeI (YjbR/CyaY-like superfamily)